MKISKNKTINKNNKKPAFSDDEVSKAWFYKGVLLSAFLGLAVNVVHDCLKKYELYQLLVLLSTATFLFFLNKWIFKKR